MSKPTRRQMISTGLSAVAATAFGRIPTLSGVEANSRASESAKNILSENDKLWYHSPADHWEEALPLGNGLIGAMIFGGIPSEQIQLNEATVWAGGPHNYDNPEALTALLEIRKLIFDGKIHEAQDLANHKFMSLPLGQLQYQTVGDLHVKFQGTDHVVSDYRRELSLDTATHLVTYSIGGVTFHRETFVSHPDQVLVIRLSASQPKSLSFSVNFTSPQKSSSGGSGTSLDLKGQGTESNGIAGEVKFLARLTCEVDGGQAHVEANELRVVDAQSATLFLAIATNVRNYKELDLDPEGIVSHRLLAAKQKGFKKLHSDHVADHQKLYRRVKFALEPARSGLSTDARIDAFKGGSDKDLPVLYFNYGRYLLIACSRPGGRAATLQGLWNSSTNPPWGSKYTTNINTEMNYWPAETCGLSECQEPLFDLIHDLSITGHETAKTHYGARGWVLHHNTDQWRGAAPIDGAAWGIWPTGGAWLCTHLWQHYLFTWDKHALEKHYPLMKGAAEFFVDSLVVHPVHGWLVTCPSASPENSHHGGQGLCAGPTMDMQIVRDLFSACIEASKVLGIDSVFRSEVEAKLANLAPMQVGRHGQLQEWLEDWDEYAPEQHHRHVSHLYGLFPSSQISPTKTPKLFEAARKSLELRGDEGTGWSLAWKINLWARLLDGNHALRLVKDALRPVQSRGESYSGGGGVYPNLFDAHPPFQIDGNFGFTSGIAEMLLQSHDSEIRLLPSLPDEWPNGEISGIRARGGSISVHISWKGGTLTHAKAHSNFDQVATFRYGSHVKSVLFKKGEEIEISFAS